VGYSSGWGSYLNPHFQLAGAEGVTRAGGMERSSITWASKLFSLEYVGQFVTPRRKGRGARGKSFLILMVSGFKRELTLGKN